MSGEVKEFLYVLRPVRLEMLTDRPNDAEAAALAAHAEYLSRLVEEGSGILFGRTQTADESTFGLVIFRAIDETAARFVMQSDPAVQRGVMTAELFPYKVAGMQC